MHAAANKHYSRTKHSNHAHGRRLWNHFSKSSGNRRTMRIFCRVRVGNVPNNTVRSSTRRQICVTDDALEKGSADEF